MAENNNKAIEKMAQRVLKGYDAIHQKDYMKAKQLLEPIMTLMHQEDRPNVTFLAYLAIAQIGSKDIESFLTTYEELQKYNPENKKELRLKERVDELFLELMATMQNANNETE